MAQMGSYDLAIIGGGITGLSTASHLLGKGLKSFCVFDSDGRESLSARLPKAYAFPGFYDHFTRISHVYGVTKAAEYWAFSRKACAELRSFLDKSAMAYSALPHLRVLLTEPEAKEAGVVAEEFLQLGWKAEVKKYPALHYPIQDFSEEGFVFELQNLVAKLRSQLSPEQQSSETVLSAKNEHSGYLLSLKNGAQIRARMVVLANHLGIPHFLPSLKEVFVSTAEQYLYFQGEVCAAKCAAIANYGHELLLSLGDGQYIASGARFLRKNAGIGYDSVSYDERISKFMADRLRDVFQLTTSPELKHYSLGLDCRPCDELPVIGPMFGESGILLGGGYMNQGLSLGFYAGKLLAELISSGKSPELAQGLTPARLRSLREVD